MNSDSYSIIPIHQRPDLTLECSRLINSEWPSSDARRLRTLSMSCDNFPTSLLLLKNDRVIGHSKMTLILNLEDSCFIESFVIDSACRSKGFGSMLLKGSEEYVQQRGVKTIYLSTLGQEKFYEKNGYSICKPINTFDNRNAIIPVAPIQSNTVQTETFSGPPPPPMPKNTPVVYSPCTSKVYMIKRL